MALTKVRGDGVQGMSLLSTSTALTLDANGHITKPLQPAFLAQPTSGQSNIAINTAVTVAFATEVFDNNSDYDNSTHTFTAPVTGRYQFNLQILLESIDSAAGYYQTQFTTSNRTLYHTFDPDFGQDNQYMHANVNVLTDMDASDTAVVKIFQANGTQQTDVNSVSSFSGFLVC